MNKRLVLAILTTIIIVVGIGIVQIIQQGRVENQKVPSEQSITPKELNQTTHETEYGRVTIRAVNLDNDEIIANVTIEEQHLEGITTPFELLLPYGSYKIIAKYYEIEIQRIVTVNQPFQEITLQVNIHRPTVDLEITTDELLARISKASNGDKEMEQWLNSLQNKTIRITGEATRIVKRGGGVAEIIFYRPIYGLYLLGVAGPEDVILKAGWKETEISSLGGVPIEGQKGDIVTLEIKDLRIFSGMQYWRANLLRIVKIY